MTLSSYKKSQIITKRAYEVMKEHGYNDDDIWPKIYGHSVCALHNRTGVGPNGEVDNTFWFYVMDDIEDVTMFEELKEITFRCEELNDDCHFDYELRGPAIMA